MHTLSRRRFGRDIWIGILLFGGPLGMIIYQLLPRSPSDTELFREYVRVAYEGRAAGNEKPVLYNGIIEGRRVEVSALSTDDLEMRVSHGVEAAKPKGIPVKFPDYDMYLDSGVKGSILYILDQAVIHNPETREELWFYGTDRFTLRKWRKSAEGKGCYYDGVLFEECIVGEAIVNLRSPDSNKTTGFYHGQIDLPARLQEEFKQANMRYQIIFKKVVEDLKKANKLKRA